MRMPRFRFTVRQMMVAVAIVAIIVGSWLVLSRKVRLYRRLSSTHEVHERNYEFLLRRSDQPGRALTDGVYTWEEGGAARNGPYGRRLAREYARRQAAHARMRRAYDRAVSRPWLVIEPDSSLAASMEVPLDDPPPMPFRAANAAKVPTLSRFMAELSLSLRTTEADDAVARRAVDSALKAETAGRHAVK
jgi:hypothetical protein